MKRNAADGLFTKPSGFGFGSISLMSEPKRLRTGSKMTNEETATEIVRCLCEEGWDAYIAGGAARDILAGDVPLDYDVVTEAPYEVVKKLFSDRRVSLVGASFKVCIVDGIEVATYRKDSYFGLSAKNCQVLEAENIREDLARRDLTINSLAFCPYTGDIVDDYGGIDDLRNRIIRFTGDPKQRIYEDPCRILRACRFRAKIEGQFDPETFQAMKTYSHMVREYVAPERIRLEILKAMKCRKPSLFFDGLHEIGILDHVFPSLNACYDHEGGDYHGEIIDEHAKIVGNDLSPRNPLLRLAGFLHECGKPPAMNKSETGKVSFVGHEQAGADLVAVELRKLKFSVREISYIKGLVFHHMRSFETLTTPSAVRKMLKAFREDGVNWKDWIQLRIADRKGNTKKADYHRFQIKDIVLAIHKELKPAFAPAVLSIKDLAVRGDDVMKALGLKPGPEVGRILKALMDFCPG
jgi:tRNA nucleotidyltransferase (CCA-adding enzyme)